MSNSQGVRAALAAFSGATAILFPPVSLVQLFCLAVTAALAWEASTGSHARLLRLGITLLIGCVVFELIGSHVLIALFAAIYLTLTGRIALALVIASWLFSVKMSLIAHLAEMLFFYRLEFLAPFLLFTLCFSFACRWRHVSVCIFLLLTGGAIGFLAREVLSEPVFWLRCFSLLFILVFAHAAIIKVEKSLRPIVTYSVITACLCGISWVINPPHTLGKLWVLLPSDTKAYESKFFRDYDKILRFTGLEAELVNSLDQVPEKGTLFLPWLTSPIAQDDVFLNIAQKKRLTIVVLGEHSNLGDIKTRLDRISGAILLNDDLSVPEGNSDFSGQLRTSGILPVPVNAVFNRGATVRMAALSSRALVVAESWWAEPHLDEWLWTGDYLFHGSERIGVLPLVVSTRIKSTSWVVIGDTSPFVTPQLIADPRPALRFLQIISQWPAFLMDLLLFSYVLALAFRKIPGLSLTVWVSLLCVAVFYRFPPEAWRNIYVGESGFNPRNFNIQLSENPNILESYVVFRKDDMNGDWSSKAQHAVLFTHVSDTLVINDRVTLSSCRRVGRVNLDEGLFIMDGQLCKVDGSVRPLIGSKESAYAFEVDDQGKRLVVVLDRKFMSDDAPRKNANWLNEQLFVRTPPTKGVSD